MSTSAALRELPNPREHLKKTRCSIATPCRLCRADQEFLRRKRRPLSNCGDVQITTADLFAGCGGMTLGLFEATRRLGYRLNVSLAVDSDESAIEIYRSNFPDARVHAADVCALFGGDLGSAPTAEEKRIAAVVGELDILVGGPPCQGHSDLNNHTRRDDPKNVLYLRMARAVEVLLPTVVVIENVATVHLDRAGVLQATSDALAALGYNVAGKVIDLRRVGVPQQRRRYLLLATNLLHIEPANILDALQAAIPSHPDRTMRWAIHDLMPAHGKTAFDTAGQPSCENARRMDLLFALGLYDLPNQFRPKCHSEKDHSYVSMYGRLRWNRPAQTITTGFGSMGQGRYVHPQCRRTLTPHEAARLQTFPDWFNFGEGTPRGVLATVIGNAVPPLLMRELGSGVLPAVVAAKESSHIETRKSA